MERCEVSDVFAVTPQRLFEAWMDSTEHRSFTGSAAEIENRIGGRFTAWDGYIEGTTLELVPFRRIVQSWRTTDFPEGSPDSKLVVGFEEVADGTRITLTHTDIPDGQSEGYERGWIDYYFAPMRDYFSAGS